MLDCLSEYRPVGPGPYTYTFRPHGKNPSNISTGRDLSLHVTIKPPPQLSAPHSRSSIIDESQAFFAFRSWINSSDEPILLGGISALMITTARIEEKHFQHVPLQKRPGACGQITPTKSSPSSSFSASSSSSSSSRNTAFLLTRSSASAASTLQHQRRLLPSSTMLETRYISPMP